jgi:RIO kinase 1
VKKDFDIEQTRRRADSVKKDLERHKTEGGVFSYTTLEAIGKLGSEGHVDRIIGPIATGKEADVFLGEKGGHKMVIKIFRMSSASYFRNPSVLQYIMGDERFRKVKKTPKDLIKSWAMKEFRNLKKAEEIGINSPRPIAIEKNVIVMQYIGQDNPSRQLLRTEMKNPEEVFKEIVSDIRKMYKNSFVHTDLSEYNILLRGEEPFIIDFGQGVLLTHPKAEEFLERDVKNICNFFRKKGVDCDPEETLKNIKSQKPKSKES